jgi:parallel beta-helix repeat protein
MSLLSCVGFNLVKAEASISYPVHNLNNGLSYTRIQEAIDANETLDGHTILVDEGTYNENVVVDKSVSLTGESRERTIINSNQSTQDNFVFLVNRTCDVVVENFTIQNCKAGVFLLNSNNSRISRNRMMNCTWEGVWVYGSHDNFIDRNFFGTSYMGVFIAGEKEGSPGNNTILANTFDRNTEAAIAITSSIHDLVLSNSITQNQIGIDLKYAAHNNSIIANTFQDNIIDVSFSGSHNNTFYHNNFITDSRNLSNSPADSIWDNGYPSGGNYWSSYDSFDTNGDGIGDTPYIIDANNIDNYPLMGMFSEFNVSLPYDKTENVTVISNSTVSNLSLLIWLSSPYNGLQPGQPFIQFFDTGENGSVGFCRLMIPRTVLNSSSYIVLVDSNPVNATELPSSNSTHVYLYFTYAHSTHEVIVTIPEFASYLMLSLFIIATLLAATLCKRKRSPNVN